MNLPTSVQEIADIIGAERALYLISQLPRCQRRDSRNPNADRSRPVLYVPKKMTPDHPLAVILGIDDARALSEALGGEGFHPAACANIQRAQRNATIARMKRAGSTAAEIAEAVALTQRQVRNIIKEIPAMDGTGANDNNRVVDTPPINSTIATVEQR